MRGADEAVGLVQMLECPIKGLHEFVLQELSICQVPSSSALVVAAAISCTRNTQLQPQHCDHACSSAWQSWKPLQWREGNDLAAHL